MSLGPFKSSKENILIALISGDVLLLLISILSAEQLANRSIDGSLLLITFFALFTLLCSFILDIYSIQDNRQITNAPLLAFVAIAAPTLLTILIDDYWYQGGYSLWLIIGSVFYLLQHIWHNLFCFLIRSQLFAKNVIVIGTGERAVTTKMLLDSACCREFSGFVSSTFEPRSDLIKEGEILCDIEEIAEYVANNKVDVIINALTERRGNLPTDQLLTCKLLGCSTIDFPTFYEHQSGKLPIESMNPGWLVFSHGFRVTTFLRVSKRLSDIILASLGLLISSPVYPFIALVIKFSSPGPLIYSQIRVGEGGRDFTIFKFRSMRQNAEAKTGAVMSQKNDPRITKVGSILRRTRLDELPQLYNILRGDMSFIGPRPERPEFVDEIIKTTPYYMERHYIKPGLTGWAQIKYPYGDSYGDTVEKLRYDLYYINNFSFLLDIFILLETIKVVLRKQYGR